MTYDAINSKKKSFHENQRIFLKEIVIKQFLLEIYYLLFNNKKPYQAHFLRVTLFWY